MRTRCTRRTRRIRRRCTRRIRRRRPHRRCTHCRPRCRRRRARSRPWSALASVAHLHRAHRRGYPPVAGDRRGEDPRSRRSAHPSAPDSAPPGDSEDSLPSARDIGVLLRGQLGLRVAAPPSRGGSRQDPALGVHVGRQRPEFRLAHGEPFCASSNFDTQMGHLSIILTSARVCTDQRTQRGQRPNQNMAQLGVH